jgi:succinate dehydrogenase (ubiquinone) membrane anchor subunit
MPLYEQIFLIYRFLFENCRGLEAIVIDYVRPIVFGNAIPKIALGLLYLMSVGCLGGLFYFIYHDIGIVNTIKRIWGIGAKH